MRPDTTPGQQTRTGILHLRFEEKRGKTVLARDQQKAPLMIIRPFELPCGTLMVFVVNPTGGVLGGDHSEIVAEVGAGARALILTQSATRLQPSPSGARATQDIRFRVASGGRLEYYPERTLPFAGSAFPRPCGPTSKTAQNWASAKHWRLGASIWASGWLLPTTAAARKSGAGRSASTLISGGSLPVRRPALRESGVSWTMRRRGCSSDRAPFRTGPLNLEDSPAASRRAAQSGSGQRQPVARCWTPTWVRRGNLSGSNCSERRPSRSGAECGHVLRQPGRRIPALTPTSCPRTAPCRHCTRTSACIAPSRTRRSSGCRTSRSAGRSPDSVPASRRGRSRQPDPAARCRTAPAWRGRAR